MRPKQVIDALKALIPTRRAVYLWGPPGVGKSSIVRQVAEGLDMDVLDLRAPLLDPVDLRGLPVPNGDVVHWKPPSFLPIKGRMGGRKGIIFADELAGAVPLVQNAFSQGILDHRFGETELDPDWVWVAASNRQEDRAATHRTPTMLLNRFIHLDLEVSNLDWQAWAADNGINYRVRSFMELRPTALHEFDPSAGARAFPTPRSWHFVSDILDSVPVELRHSVFAGCVGEGHAADFTGYLEYHEKMPKLSDILAKPATFRIPEEPNICCALAGALSEACREPANLEKVATYVARWQPEYAAWGMRLCTAVGKVPFTTTKAASQWTNKNYSLLTA